MLSRPVPVDNMICRPPLLTVKLDDSVLDPVKVWVDLKSNISLKPMLLPKKAEAVTLDSDDRYPSVPWRIRLLAETTNEEKVMPRDSGWPEIVLMYMASVFMVAEFAS